MSKGVSYYKPATPPPVRPPATLHTHTHAHTHVRLTQRLVHCLATARQAGEVGNEGRGTGPNGQPTPIELDQVKGLSFVNGFYVAGIISFPFDRAIIPGH